jgi:septal ring factor EnvC (AmiA/AmiB activator)
MIMNDLLKLFMVSQVFDEDTARDALSALRSIVSPDRFNSVVQCLNSASDFKRALGESRSSQSELGQVVRLIQELSEKEKKLREQLNELNHRLVGIEMTKQMLENHLQSEFRSQPVPAELREQALQVHPQEQFEALIQKMRSVGGFSLQECLPEAERDRESVS